MTNLVHKPYNIKNSSTMTYYFELEELDILAEVLKIETCQKGETIPLPADCPMVVVSNLRVSDHKKAKVAFRLEQPGREKNISFTAETDGIYFTLEKDKIQLLLEEHIFLTMKLNHILNTQLTSILYTSLLN